MGNCFICLYSRCEVLLRPVHTSDKVDCYRNRLGDKLDCRRYGRLCRWFWRQIGNDLNSEACRSQHCHHLGRCCRQSRLCRPNVECPFDFIATRQCVRGQTCQSNTVDFVGFQQSQRVEFNFVASVYRALEEQHRSSSVTRRVLVAYCCNIV